MKVKWIKKISAIMLSLLLVGMLMPVMHVKADGDIEVNETNFPDANFRSFVKEKYDTDPDDKLTSAEIAAVITMNCSNEHDAQKRISNLKGIEYFTALTNLNCSYNNLTSLDISGDSNLETLNCSFNQITSLDVSSYTALEKLVCHSNQLNSLDVSGDTALKELNCSSNNLTELNIGNNTNLEILDCHYNYELTSLNVSANTKLTSLDCHGNQLTSLDVSTNTALTELDCSVNQIGALDVSENKALKNFFCNNNKITSLVLTENTALTDLKCYGNEIASLDLSKNTALTTLDCNSNQLKTLDVSNNKKLKGFICNHNPLTALKVSFDDGAETVTVSNGGHGTFDVVIKYKDTEQQIPNNTITIANPTPTITGYDFTGWDIAAGGDATQENITTATRFTVGSANSTITALWKVDINAANFPDEKFRNFIINDLTDDNGDHIGADRVLTQVEISGVTDMDCSSKSISDLTGIGYFTNLSNLRCSSNQLTSLDVTNNTALEDLSCFSNQLTSLDVTNNTALENLFCYSNQITSLNVSAKETLI